MRERRIIASAVLLAVFLPAFLISVLHRHPEAVPAAEECAECVHHLPHQGHIGAYHGGISDCVLCQFLGLPFIASIAVAAVLSVVLGNSFYLFTSRPFLQAALRNDNTRAPPVSFCFQ